MANKEVSELTAGTNPTGAELFHGVQAGNSRKFTYDQMVGWLALLTAKLATNIARLDGNVVNLIGGFADSFEDSSGINTGSSTNEEITGGTLKPTNPHVQIAQATGTAIGDMTGAGGLAAAFDSDETQNNAAAAFETGSGAQTSYIGKDWGSGNTKRISQVIVISSDDRGFINGADGLVSFRLLGSNTNNTGTATELATWTFTEAAAPPYTVTKNTGINITTAYRYHWLELSHNVGGSGTFVGELKFYEAPTDNMTALTAALTLPAEPAFVDVYGIREDIDSVTINTDFTVEASIDGGSTWATGTIVAVETAGSLKVWKATGIDVSAQTGTSLVLRLKTLNNKMLYIHDLYARAY